MRYRYRVSDDALTVQNISASRVYIVLATIVAIAIACLVVVAQQLLGNAQSKPKPINVEWRQVNSGPIVPIANKKADKSTKQIPGCFPTEAFAEVAQQNDARTLAIGTDAAGNLLMLMIFPDKHFITVTVPPPGTMTCITSAAHDVDWDKKIYQLFSLNLGIGQES